MCEEEFIGSLDDPFIQITRKLGPFTASYDIERMEKLEKQYLPFINNYPRRKQAYVTFKEYDVELFKIPCTFYHDVDPSVHFYLEKGKEMNRENVLFCIYEGYNNFNIYNMMQVKQNTTKLIGSVMEMISTIIVPDGQPDKLVISYWMWGPCFLSSIFDKKEVFEMKMNCSKFIKKVMYRGIERTTDGNGNGDGDTSSAASSDEAGDADEDAAGDAASPATKAGN